MSYRTIKRVLGETSLERKCRFLFGGGLMLLIFGAFWLYGRLNLRIVEERIRDRARQLAKPELLILHENAARPGMPGDDAPAVQSRQLLDGLRIGNDADTLATPLLPDPLPEGLIADAVEGPIDSPGGDRRYSFAILSADPQTTDAAKRPLVQAGYDAVARIVRQEVEEVSLNDRDAGLFRYYGAIRAEESCIACHRSSVPGEDDLQLDDLLGIARVAFPLAETEREIARNNALLIAMGFIVATLAMIAAWLIVRYVIVKPLLHLKEVSDQIAHGELHQRADIRTGDEFEELSLAFNRMLRYLVSMQEDLRTANSELDGKVDELAQANLSLFEMNKIKNEFLATMSHELRTPLNSILGFSEVLSGADNLNQRQQRYVKNIDTSGRSLLALIDDILDLAKIEAGKMRRTISEFSLAQIIEHQLSALQPLAEKRTIELTSRVDPDLPAMFSDQGKLQQILSNLLSNAVKFTPEGGRVRVEADYLPGERPPGSYRKTQPEVEIRIIDTGIGVPLNDQAVIFEKFRQGRSGPDGGGGGEALTREYEGTGLGLSIVKELSRLLGGEVGLTSEFGKGSTFWVRLPIEIRPTAEESEAQRTSDHLAGV